MKAQLLHAFLIAVAILLLHESVHEERDDGQEDDRGDIDALVLEEVHVRYRPRARLRTQSRATIARSAAAPMATPGSSVSHRELGEGGVMPGAVH